MQTPLVAMTGFVSTDGVRLSEYLVITSDWIEIAMYHNRETLAQQINYINV